MKIAATGIDIVEIERIRKALERHGESFERRVLTPAEKSRCPDRPGPRARVIAMLWAGKEAVLKITGTGVLGELGLDEIEIATDGKGLPFAVMNDKLRRLLEARAGAADFRLHLSLASSKMTACSAAMLTVGGAGPREPSSDTR